MGASHQRCLIQRNYPFYVHGTQFQVADRSRGGHTAANPLLAWKDTVKPRRRLASSNPNLDF